MTSLADDDDCIDMDQLILLVKKNCYIKNCKSNKKRCESSISSLITRTLSQSDCIKLGHGIEKYLIDFVTHYRKDIKNIKEKNIKGKKEKDHLYVDDEKKYIYYAELKANLNLDTEKSKSTYKKCLEIVLELQEKYSDYIIKWCLVGLRYTDITKIEKHILKKYNAIKPNVFGINDYFNMLGINFNFTDDTYKILLNNIADEMFD